MIRIIKYIWFRFIMAMTGWMLDFTPALRIRGFLLKPAFKSCGKNLQIASGTLINWSSNVTIGDNVFIANNCWIQGVGEIELQDQVMLGPFTVLASNNHTQKNGSYRFAPHKKEKITLQHGSWTGAHTVITYGVNIGEGTAVAANAVVTKDTPNNCVVGGVPANIIKPAGKN